MLSRVSARSYSSAAQAIKVSTKDASTNLSSLSVVVNNSGAKAGKSGVAHLLSKFNFLNTQAKSALRFTRESELLGGNFSSNVTRDAIVLKTQFLQEDLPYYVEALGNVLANTSFRPHEFPETVLPVAKAEYEASRASNTFVAVEALHELSFRKGLGNPLYYDGTNKVSVEEVQQFASEAYNTSNVSVFASGVNGEDLKQFLNETAFSALPAGSAASTPVKAYNDKETRIRAAGQSAAIIGVPVKVADFGKYEVLSAAAGSAFLQGSGAPLSKIPGASSQLYKYNDAGLFVVSVVGEASAVAEGIKQAKKAVESLSSSDLTNATKAAELSVALQSSYDSPLEIKLSAPSSASLKGFNYVAIGNVDVLPYANEL